MTDGGYGMVEDHPGAGIAHHRPDFLFHVGAIAMHDALAAARLGFAERAL